MKQLRLWFASHFGSGFSRARARARRVRFDMTPEQVRRLLGEPDRVVVATDDERIADGEDEIDPRYPEENWHYANPYRPRIQYCFGFSQGRVIEISEPRYAGCRQCGAPLVDAPVCLKCGTDHSAK